MNTLDYQIPVPPRGVLVVCCVFVLAGQPATAESAPGIRVESNQIVTTSAGTLGVRKVGADVPVVLRGVNFSGAEYACLEKHFFFGIIPKKIRQRLTQC